MVLHKAFAVNLQAQVLIAKDPSSANLFLHINSMGFFNSPHQGKEKSPLHVLKQVTTS